MAKQLAFDAEAQETLCDEARYVERSEPGASHPDGTGATRQQRPDQLR